MSPLMHVDELRQLVDVPLAQGMPEPRDTRVVVPRLAHHVAVVERRHGAELDDAEFLLVEAVAPLPEEQRAPALEQDRDCYEREQGRERDQHAGRGHHVEDALERALAPVERRARELQARHAAVLDDAHIVEAVEDALRPEVDLDRHLEEFLDAAVDRAGLGPWRHDVDRFGVERARALERLAQIASSAARRSSRVENESSRVSGARRPCAGRNSTADSGARSRRCPRRCRSGMHAAR
jgi:hypothetical protein